MFILGTLCIGPNFGLCSNFVTFFFNVIFQLSILSLLCVVGLYWVKINIFEALGLLLGLGFFAFLVGTYSLKKVHKAK